MGGDWLEFEKEVGLHIKWEWLGEWVGVNEK